MASVIDVWRAVDPDARLLWGPVGALAHVARGAATSRIRPPHLPPSLDGLIFVVDTQLLRSTSLDALLAGVAAAGLAPVAILLAGEGSSLRDVPPLAAGDLPILASGRAAARLTEEIGRYLSNEPAFLSAFAAELRLGGAEAALADPAPGSPAGLLAARLRRGVAVAAEGELRALNPRAAGRALAARFAATFARHLAAGPARREPLRRQLDGLWLFEHRVHAGASVWLFDDLPFARIDEVGAEALGITLRALLRRPRSAPPAAAATAKPEGDSLDVTLLAVARANGRVAAAARALGVHRNTVLYRLRRASAERGIDPRRAEDALRLLRRSDDG